MFISALGSPSIAAEFVGAPQPLHLDKVGTPIAQSGHAYTASGAPFARVSTDMAARRTVNLANARKAAQTVLPTVVLAVMPNAVQAGQDSLLVPTIKQAFADAAQATYKDSAFALGIFAALGAATFALKKAVDQWDQNRLMVAETEALLAQNTSSEVV
jgi:hypothetical protein